MGSISTTRGDGGETGLAGGIRVSKGSVRVEAYGSVDELNSALGFARSICDDPEIGEFTRAIQQELFRDRIVAGHAAAESEAAGRRSSRSWSIG